MAKLRTTSTSTAAAPENFPATSPPLIPRFASKGTRKQRVINKVVKLNDHRVPAVPWQLADGSPSPQIQQQLEGFDPTNDEAVKQITDIVCRVLAGMGIVEVEVEGVSKKKKRGPSQMAAAVKKQQAELTSEQDKLYKVRGITLWAIH